MCFIVKSQSFKSCQKHNKINLHGIGNLTFILAKSCHFFTQLRFKIRLFLKVAMKWRNIFSFPCAHKGFSPFRRKVIPYRCFGIF